MTAAVYCILCSKFNYIIIILYAQFVLLYVLSLPTGMYIFPRIQASYNKG